MQVACGQVQRLARRQHDQVEQQRGEHARVAGVALGQLQRHPRLAGELAALLGEPHAGGLQRGHRTVEHRLRKGDPRGEQGAQARGVRLGRQQRDVRGQLGDVQRAQQREGLRDLAEADQRVELGERADQLGLVARVAVVAGGRVDGDAGGVLPREALGGLGRARVRLQAQRLVRREHLEQVRQVPRPLGGPVRTEQPLGVRADGVEQRRAPAVAADEVGGVTRVRTEPHLRLGVRRRRRLTAQLGDHGARTPGIRAHGVLQQLHDGSFSVSRQWSGGVGSTPQESSDALRRVRWCGLARPR